MFTTILHVILLVLILAAWRFGVLWFRPFHEDGRARLGGARVARVRATATAALADRLRGLR